MWLHCKGVVSLCLFMLLHWWLEQWDLWRRWIMLGTTRRAHQGDHRICLNFSSETSLFSFWQNSSSRRRSESRRELMTREVQKFKYGRGRGGEPTIRHIQHFTTAFTSLQLSVPQAAVLSWLPGWGAHIFRKLEWSLLTSVVIGAGTVLSAHSVNEKLRRKETNSDTRVNKRNGQTSSGTFTVLHTSHYPQTVWCDIAPSSGSWRNPGYAFWKWNKIIWKKHTVNTISVFCIISNKPTSTEMRFTEMTLQ